MIKINIQTEVATKEELVEMLHVIANQIDNGMTSGYYPTFDVIDETHRIGKIDYIKKVLSEWGMVSTGDLELDSSPMYNSMGSNHVMLIEEFTQDYVRVIEYVHESIVNEFEVDYEELSDDLIDEVYDIIEGYETDMLKTEKRCKD